LAHISEVSVRGWLAFVLLVFVKAHIMARVGSEESHSPHGSQEAESEISISPTRAHPQ
jgi:hypothetical protein